MSETSLTAIVTGAGSGIGRATALRLARTGARVLAVGRREAALAQTAQLQRRENPDGHIDILPADITDPEAPQTITAAAKARWDRLDILVNNAGYLEIMPLAELSADRVRRLWEVNVTAPSLLAHHALPLLRDTGGTIVNVSSVFGQRPGAEISHYAASKAALEQLTRSWALELAPDRIRVNAVAPGPVKSEALSAAGMSAEEAAELETAEAARIPLGRRGEPEEIADWVWNLANPASTWLTGQVITVDGGLNLT
ncbi:NAD(P)-dependent dehydrogenase (short-subunit alcohol dehydrogenase family) [Stackebrandtia endophytica]|uniref:NAD(P)-dependent dehydrogenase (Short-subunit alcohol dehydrogenase family) n=1 Tax=Stackebrandtia endophytica TaxID=1496996 RepID=A0A543ASR3_9ACTN|nr:SDR family oxidoreductase [Stackebrandtia endophytica]TQL75624.1 NAD(P)-dependent dehydrogenase (short-subunit alcohol dehydrogenase family) [Stackebrandtia endophytica]